MPSTTHLLHEPGCPCGDASPLRPGLTRRSFLAGGATATLAGLALPSMLPPLRLRHAGGPSTGDALVVVFLSGGADGLSMVVPYSDTNPGGYYSRRGQGTSNDISVLAPGGGPGSCLDLEAANGGHEFGLHQGMGGADGNGGRMGIWEAGDLAIVHAVGMPASESPSRSHFEAQDHCLVPGPENDLAVTTDIRTVLAEVLQARCGGADLGTVFPTYTPAAPLGIVS